MNKDRMRSQQRKPKQGIRIEEKKWILKPYDEENQSLPPQQQLNNISEFIQPSLESARKHPKSNNGFDPNHHPHVMEETRSKVAFKKEKQEEKVRESEKSKDKVDDIRSRLEDIRLVAEEPKLSEEQLRVNDKLQEEEILAMEAIYRENIIVLDREDGLRAFQINIHIEVPDKLVMSTKIGSLCGEAESAGVGSEAKAIADNPNRFFYSFKVQCLPPIVLTCLLPKAYPSHSAPFFTISVLWMNVTRISSLCQMLDTIWTEQSGQEIVYPWVDWLQNSSLSYLEFDNIIPLDSFEKADNAGDRRAVSESVSPEVDIPSILNYNDDKCNEIFCQNLHQCCICLSEYAGTKFVRLPCKHFFCRNCMETYSTMHAKESVAILCPQVKCGELVPPGLVRSLIGDEKFEHWESKLFHVTLDSMSDLVYCPRCEMACLEDDDHLAQCPRCFFSSCCLCRDRFHVGVQCTTPEEKLKFLQIGNRQHFTKLMAQQKQKELDMINQLRSMEEIMRISKQCPNCMMAISRTEGCNHMHCSNCEHDFCYKCGEEYDMGKYSCKNCVLFDEETIRRWEAEMTPRQTGLLRQERQILNEVRAEDPANHPSSCPICRQMNTKVENNNHIFCWSCEKHYCYLCRKIVKRGSQHYGPKGCKQHSAG
ncbi:E3 ubiquitin-protein ligase RNF14-like [Papaver somniferum]|uniref:E3 ubiquitin-protein ligase RNF14-like n=1 Tax=Papaver somniferum TaxID=3469 RepID=UPI000E6F8BF8|nr:E3 ubiquitin-protein ligase RNF14-like [Papaver somniferum]